MKKGAGDVVHQSPKKQLKSKSPKKTVVDKEKATKETEKSKEKVVVESSKELISSKSGVLKSLRKLSQKSRTS